MEKQHSVTFRDEAKRSGALWIPLALLFLIVIFFELAPAAYILFSSFNSDNGMTFANYAEAFTSKYYRLALLHSIVLAIVSALIGIAVGTIAALCIKGLSAGASNRILTFINTTTNYAGVPLAFAFMVLLGTTGVVTVFMKNVMGVDIYNSGFNLYSWGGLTLVYVYFQIPLAIMLMFPAAGSIKDSTREAAKILGANNFKFWIRIGIPTLLPAILGSLCILFANALGAYATAYALVASNKGILAICVANLVSGDMSANPYLACSLATIMGAILMVMLFIKSKLYKRSV